MVNVGVIGAGSWGTALATVLNKNGNAVTVWSIVKEEIEMLNKHYEHKDKLPSIKLSNKIIFTSDLKKAIKDKDIIILAVPSKFVRSTAKLISPLIENKQIIVNVAKGLEDKTLYTLTDILEEEIPNNPITVLSGPSHAEEVAREIPTTCVVGAQDNIIAEKVQDIFMNDTFRVYTSNDILGIELGGALKNVIALAAGISDGLGYGDNTKAALMTRGIAEIGRLGIAMGADMYTFSGLSGIGDLIVTCTSMHSRNRKAGILIGKGATLKEALDEVKMVVEGVNSAEAALALANKNNIEMPIIQKVNEVLFKNKDPKIAVKELMLRDKANELKDIM